jgi:hypothetical protein
MVPKELRNLINEAVKIHKENNNFKIVIAAPGERNHAYDFLITYKPIYEVVEKFVEAFSIDLGDGSVAQRTIYNAMNASDDPAYSPNPFMVDFMPGVSLFEANTPMALTPEQYAEFSKDFLYAIKLVIAAKFGLIAEDEMDADVLKIQKRYLESKRGPDTDPPPSDPPPSDLPESDPLKDLMDKVNRTEAERAENYANKDKLASEIMSKMFYDFVNNNFDYSEMKGNQRKITYLIKVINFGDNPSFEIFWKSLPRTKFFKNPIIQKILNEELECIQEIPKKEAPMEEVPPIPPVPPVPPEPAPIPPTASRYRIHRIVLSVDDPEPPVLDSPPPEPSPIDPIDTPDPAPPVDEPVENMPVKFYEAGLMKYKCNPEEISKLMTDLLVVVKKELLKNPWEKIIDSVPVDYLVEGLNTFNALPPARRKDRLF